MVPCGNGSWLRFCRSVCEWRQGKRKYDKLTLSYPVCVFVIHLVGHTQVATKAGADRSLQSRQELVIGAHADHQYSLIGNVSNLIVLQCPAEPTEADVQVSGAQFGYFNADLPNVR